MQMPLRFSISFLALLFSIFCTESQADEADLERAVSFVAEHMPAPDKGTVTPEWIRSDVRNALSMRNRFQWSERIPDAIYLNYVVPYGILNERREDWRTVLKEKYAPLVASCRTAEQAVWRIASRMSADTDVVYSRERRHPVMSALEALQEKKVSCTGQSILLICALRSVGIPARAVGVSTWNHIPGNHTWAEAWYNGSWHMIEFNEKKENTPWVMENIGMLDTTRPEQQIIAASWAPAEKETFFPLIPVFGFPERIPGENVTSRYSALSRAWYEQEGLSRNEQRIFIEVTDNTSGRAHRMSARVLLLAPDGTVVTEGESPGSRDDMRKFLRFTMPRMEGCTLLVLNRDTGALLATRSIAPNDQATQLIRMALLDTSE